MDVRSAGVGNALNGAVDLIGSSQWTRNGRSDNTVIELPALEQGFADSSISMVATLCIAEFIRMRLHSVLYAAFMPISVAVLFAINLLP